MKVEFVVEPSSFNRSVVSANLSYSKMKKVKLACPDNPWWVERQYEMRPASRQVVVGEFDAVLPSSSATLDFLRSSPGRESGVAAHPYPRARRCLATIRFSVARGKSNFCPSY